MLFDTQTSGGGGGGGGENYEGMAMEDFPCQKVIRQVE